MFLKRYRCLFVLPLVLMAVPCLGQKPLTEWTLEEVLEAVVDANGGWENIEKVTNVRFLGEVVSEDTSFQFVILKRRPDMMRARMESPLRVMETGFDGTTAWRRMKYRGFDRVTEITDPVTKQSILLEADFDGLLIGDPPEGVSRKLAGVERIDRVDYFVVEVGTFRGTQRFYVDSRTFRQLKVVSEQTGPDGETEREVTWFEENRRHNGIWIAHKVVKEHSDGRTEVARMHEVDINPGMLSFPFRMPEERNPPPQN